MDHFSRKSPPGGFFTLDTKIKIKCLLPGEWGKANYSVEIGNQLTNQAIIDRSKIYRDNPLQEKALDYSSLMHHHLKFSALHSPNSSRARPKSSFTVFTGLAV